MSNQRTPLVTLIWYNMQTEQLDNSQSYAQIGQFAKMLNPWMHRYNTGRLKVFKKGNDAVLDTIDGERPKLDLAA